MDWTMPQPPTEPSAASAQNGRWRRFGGKAALVGAGLVAGGVLATTISANAAPGSTSTPSASSESGSATDCGPGGHRGGGDLSNTGTVTAVGASTVSIRDSAGKVTTYTVTSSSDIDKNGEAKLSDLKAGDAVRFSTTNGTTIAILHSGDENLNRPQGGHPGGGQPPAGYGYGG